MQRLLFINYAKNMTKDDICRITFIIEDSGTGLTIKDLEKTYNNNDSNIQKDNIIRAKQEVKNLFYLK